jgi:hypothetical protein
LEDLSELDVQGSAGDVGVGGDVMRWVVAAHNTGRLIAEKKGMIEIPPQVSTVLPHTHSPFWPSTGQI